MSAFWSSQALGNEDQDPVIMFQVWKGHPCNGSTIVQFKAAQLRRKDLPFLKICPCIVRPSQWHPASAVWELNQYRVQQQLKVFW